MVDEKQPKTVKEQPIDMIVADQRYYGVYEQRLIASKTLFTNNGEMDNLKIEQINP